MALTVLKSLTERPLCSVKYGPLLYVGTDQGHLYSITASGTITLLKTLEAKIVSLAVFNLTLHITTDQGKAYTYDLDLPAFDSQENAYFALGTYSVAVTINDTDATFVPIQINLKSTGNIGAAGRQVASARLRVDVATNHQANTAVSCLQLRMDLAKNCYAATNISASINVSADIALPTATMQSIFAQITGAGIITCPNNVNVAEFRAFQTAPGAGIDNVLEAAMNGSGCTITNIAMFKNYAGTVTNGVLIDGTMTHGIYLPDTFSGQGILVGASSSSPVTTTSTGTTNMVEVNSKLNAASGVLRGILSFAEFSGTNAGVSTNLYAMRGYAKVSGTFNTDAYAAGVQGKVEMSGTLQDGGKIAAILAQINSSAGTFTSGQISALWVSSQLTSGQVSGMSSAARSGYNMIKVENGALCNAMFFLYGYADYLMEISVIGGDWAQGTINPTVPSGRLRLKVNGADKYIQLYNLPS